MSITLVEAKIIMRSNIIMMKMNQNEIDGSSVMIQAYEKILNHMDNLENKNKINAMMAPVKKNKQPEPLPAPPENGNV